LKEVDRLKRIRYACDPSVSRCKLENHHCDQSRQNGGITVYPLTLPEHCYAHWLLMENGDEVEANAWAVRVIKGRMNPIQLEEFSLMVEVRRSRY